MSYVTKMNAKEIDCLIPLNDIEWVINNFWIVEFETETEIKNRVRIIKAWEEDESEIKGILSEKQIVLDAKQSGSFKNSSDGGLSELLERYKGSGIIETSGEERGDHEILKYEKGNYKRGKVVYDE